MCFDTVDVKRSSTAVLTPIIIAVVFGSAVLVLFAYLYYRRKKKMSALQSTNAFAVYELTHDEL